VAWAWNPKNSGLKINKKYESYDAEKMIEVEVEPTIEPKGCICGLILKGEKTKRIADYSEVHVLHQILLEHAWFQAKVHARHIICIIDSMRV